jgi:hypothetical protein
MMRLLFLGLVARALLAGNLAFANMVLIPPPAGVTYTGPLDVVSSATACWSLRACSAAKRGTASINVCNVSDVVCADLSTDATTGALVITTIGGSSCGSITCTVKTIYDQSGNGFNMTQATIAKRPTLTVSCFGSLPCMTGSGTQFLSIAGGIGVLNQPLTTSYVAERTAAFSAYSDVIGNNNSSQVGFQVTNEAFAYAGAQINATATDSAAHSVQTVLATTSSLDVDGAAAVTGSTGSPGYTAAQTDIFGCGSGASSCNVLTGNVGEVIVWPSGLTTPQQNNICHNQTYWGAFGC